MSDGELIARLEQNCEIIMNTVAALVTRITRDRNLSPALIDQVKKTVTEVGQFMSLIEDIKFDVALDVDNLVSDFKQKKEILYASINDLVTASSTGEDGFDPANALGLMLESATSVLEGIEDVLVASKLLIDRKELISQKSLYNQSESLDENSELSILQKRAQALTFFDQSASFGASESLNSARLASSSGHPWSQSASGESRTAGSISSDQRSAGKRTSEVSNANSQRKPSQEPVTPEPVSGNKLAKFFGEDDLPSTGRLSDVLSTN